MKIAALRNRLAKRMDVVTFASQISGYLFLGFAIFWSVAGVALHGRLESPLWLAFTLTFTLQFLGMTILLIRYFFLRANNEAKLVESDWSPDTWSESQESVSFGWQSGSEVEDYGERKGKSLSSWTIFGLLSAAFLGMTLTIWLPWFYQTIELFDPAVYVFSSGLEVWLLFSLASFASAAALSLFGKTYLWTSLLVSHFASWWLALSLASLIDRLSFIRAMEAMFNLPNLITGLEGGFGFEFVSQTAGEAWFVIFPASALAVAAAYLLARDYSQTRS